MSSPSLGRSANIAIGSYVSDAIQKVMPLCILCNSYLQELTKKTRNYKQQVNLGQSVHKHGAIQPLTLLLSQYRSFCCWL